MKVSGGYLKGRQFKSPPGFATHPISERVKMALFNMLGDINGLTVFDPFGGSGAISIEAISLGAESSVCLDRDFKAYQTIVENVKDLGLEDKIKVTRANAASWSENNLDKKFDLVICEPPFNDLQPNVVDKMVKHLKPNGLMVLSHPGSGSAPTVNGVVVVDNRLYGDAALAFYRQQAS